MSQESEYREFMQKYYEWQKQQTKAKARPGTTGRVGNRSVKYLAPGHTVVYYPNRTLHIYFKESKAEFQKRQKLRRKHAGSTRRLDDEIYVDRDEYGNMVYVTSSGKTATLRAKSRAEKGRNAKMKADLKRDRYTVEDMRAILNDDHWEEVCGNRRWNYDKAATVREFNKYLKRKGRN